MIIEVTGPSGAGKTTILKELIKAITDNEMLTGAIHSAELNNCDAIPDAFSNLDTQNIRTDLLAIAWCVFLTLRHPAFFVFAIRKILTLDEPVKEKIAILRSLVRKSGIYRFLKRRRFRNIIIGVDEGLFHSAHNFLMTVRGTAAQDDIKKFGNLTPLPDLIVLVTASPDELISRLKNRNDLSPRIRSDNELEPFIHNAWTLFDRLSQIPRIKDLLIVIDSERDNKDEAIKQILSNINSKISQG